MSDIIIEAFLVEPIEEAVNKESIKKLFNMIKDKLIHIIRSIIAKIKAVRDKIKEKISNKKNKNSQPNDDDDFDYGMDDNDYATDKARTWLLNYNSMPPEQKEYVHNIFKDSLGSGDELRFSKHTPGMLKDTDILIKSKDALSRIYEEVKNISSSDHLDSNSEKFVKDICKMLNIRGIDKTDSDTLYMAFNAEHNNNLVFVKFEDVIRSPLYKDLAHTFINDPRKWNKMVDIYDDCIDICEKISGALATGISKIINRPYDWIIDDPKQKQDRMRDEENDKSGRTTVINNMNDARYDVASSSNESLTQFKSYFKNIYDILKIIWFCLGANISLIGFIFDAYSKLFDAAIQIYNDNNKNNN